MGRRSVSGLLVGVTLLLASLAWAGFTLQRTVFDPARSEAVVGVLLDSDTVHDALVQQIVGAIDAALPVDVRTQVTATELGAVADAALADPAVRGGIESLVTGSHRYLLGEQSQPPSIDGSALTQSIRTQLLAARPDLATVVPELSLPTVTGPSRGLGPVRGLRDGLAEATPLLAAAALAGAVTAVLTASRRPPVIRRFGWWAVGAGGLWVAMRYLLPALTTTLFPSSAAFLTALTEAAAGSMMGPGVAVAMTGAALIAASMIMTVAGRVTPAAVRTGQAGGREHAARAGAATQRRAAQEKLASRRLATDGRRARARSAQPGTPTAAAPPGAGERTDDAGTYRPATASPAPSRTPGPQPRPGPESGSDSGSGPGSVAVGSQHPGAPAMESNTSMWPSPAAEGGAASTLPIASSPVYRSQRPDPAADAGADGGPAPTGAGPVPFPNAAADAADAAGHAPGAASADPPSQPLPRRTRTAAGSPGDGPSPSAAVLGALAPEVAAAGRAGAAAPSGGVPSPSASPAPNEWLGGFSMSPGDHRAIAEPAPPPPRWVEGVGYVYDYAPTPDATWVDGLGYVLEA